MLAMLDIMLGQYNRMLAMLDIMLGQYNRMLAMLDKASMYIIGMLHKASMDIIEGWRCWPESKSCSAKMYS